MTPARAYRAGAILLTGLTLVLTFTWALLLPSFDGPDEPWHHNSVVRLVGGGGWPLPYEAAVLESTWQAVRESGDIPPTGDPVAHPPAPADRSPALADESVPSTIPDYMLQHPPGFYGPAALAVRATGGAELRWDHAHQVMRAVCAVFLAAAVPFLIGTTRWATGSRPAGLVGGASALGVPFVTNSGGYVSNDPMLIATCSATIYLLVRAWRDPDASRLLLPLAGLAYGLALLTKGFALFLAPVVIMLALLAAWTRAPSPLGMLGLLVVPGALTVAIGGWWWIRNRLLLGTVQPSRLGGRERLAEPVDGYSLTAFLSGAAERLNVTFWGRGGRASVALPDVVPALLLVLLTVAFVLALTHRQARSAVLIVILFPIAVALTIVVNAHGIYWDTGRPHQGIQGRYLYSGLAALCIAAGAAAHILRDRMPRPFVTMIGVVTPVLVALATLGWTVPRAWAQRDTPLRFGLLPVEATGVPVAVYLLLGAALVLITLMLGAAARRLDKSERAVDSGG